MTPSNEARIVILGSKFVGKTTISDWSLLKQKATELQSTESQQNVLMSLDLIVNEETRFRRSFEYIRLMRDAIVEMRTADHHRRRRK
ncbi:hypothetical protein DPMN_023037 [Dreissena polymorpha]|uniref:Uncharacterized protein n=1 Tax=Dreissena polymorpha TaxID=45954 RepID=A0A9D4R9K3_DREPO|nr:hypothetical protein DPMN_023037 [Dreissena polymorpha]